MNKWTYFDALTWGRQCLAETGMDPEAPTFILMMLHNWSFTQLVSHYRQIMIDEEVQRFRWAVEQVAHHVPAQYVVGRAPFYGRDFIVNRDVLIPESETEELIEWVLATMPAEKPLRVLDLGTGSGVIGITLALERPNWQVTLSDISHPALTVAEMNQRLHGTQLTQVQSDLFADLEGPFDLIVTNPPYIAPDDPAVETSVRENTPGLALFADEHGLGIYRRIFMALDDVLVPGGHLFGETGYDQEGPIRALFNEVGGNGSLTTKHDINDQMRMIHVKH